MNAKDLTLRSFVNGEIRQDSSTADLIFGIDHLVRYLSQFAVLEPVDIINTGPPSGVALSGRFRISASATSWRSRSRESERHVRRAATGDGSDH